MADWVPNWVKNSNAYLVKRRDANFSQDTLVVKALVAAPNPKQSK